MIKTILFSLLVLGNVAFSQDFGGPVVSLTEENFAEIVGSAEIALVKFYAPWCGHCKQLAPQFASAASELKRKVLFAEVDCTVETKLAEQYHVQGYPTLKIFRGDLSAPTEYNGPRDADGIINYMNKQMEPIVHDIFDEIEYRALTINSEISILMYTADTTSDAYTTFAKCAADLHDTVSFGVVTDPKLMTTFGYSEGDIVAYRNFEGEDKSKRVAYDSAENADLKKWATLMSIPAAAVLSQNNYMTYQKIGVPHLVVFGKNLREETNAAGVRYVINRLRKAAVPYLGKGLVFVTSDVNSPEYSECGFAQQAEKGAKYFMGIFDGSQRYCLDPADGAMKSLKVADIEAFAADFVAGKLVPHVKSQPVPETPEENGVKIVVGSTMQEEVVDSDKDVFLAIYAPWCGHCKHLLPIWEELAEKNKGRKDRLTIAKIDGTENDVPKGFDFTGFPTIFWVKAGKDAKPVVYNGERSVEAFEAFINENKSFGNGGGDDASKDEL